MNEIHDRGRISLWNFPEKIEYGIFHSMKNQDTRKTMIGIGLQCLVWLLTWPKTGVGWPP